VAIWLDVETAQKLDRLRGATHRTVYIRALIAARAARNPTSKWTAPRWAG